MWNQLQLVVSDIFREYTISFFVRARYVFASYHRKIEKLLLITSFISL